jgi:hypothetical protein
MEGTMGGEQKTTEISDAEELAWLEELWKENPFTFELLPPPPPFKSAEEAGDYMLSVLSDALLFAGGGGDIKKKLIPPEHLLGDIFFAVRVIGYYLTTGKRPHVADRRKENISTFATMCIDEQSEEAGTMTALPMLLRSIIDAAPEDEPEGEAA